MQYSNKIKLLRESKGLSQIQLANLIEVDNSLLSKLETGKTRGSIKNLSKIAYILNVSIGELIGESKV